jgi:hypothetical protein
MKYVRRAISLLRRALMAQFFTKQKANGFRGTAITVASKVVPGAKNDTTRE